MSDAALATVASVLAMDALYMFLDPDGPKPLAVANFIALLALATAAQYR